MQLRMAARRSLSGSMTIVGDIAQATGPLAPTSWDQVLEHLPDRRPSRVIGLSIGYRIPEQIMELANRVMAVATPGLRAPQSVRVGDEAPRVIRVETDDLVAAAVIAELQHLRSSLPAGSVGVVAADDMIDDLSTALSAAEIDHGWATTTGLDSGITLVPVSVVKGLELDAVVVVEPERIVGTRPHGLRALYVALTRATRRLSVIHARDRPVPLG